MEEPLENEVQQLKSRYEAGQVGDVEVKARLQSALNRFLSPLRERRARYAAEPDMVTKILTNGQSKAQAEARETLRAARKAMRLVYPFIQEES